MIEAASEIGKSSSGSWFGYHSRVYYEDFEVPPPGAVFSQLWGLMDAYTMGSRGSWQEYRFDDVVAVIQERAGNPSIDELLKLSKKAASAFDEAKTAARSILHAKYDLKHDKFLAGLEAEIDQARLLDEGDLTEVIRPRGQMISKDMIAIEKGQFVPPHVSTLVKMSAVTFPFKACEKLKNLIVKTVNHIDNLEGNAVREEKIGTTIFIGHGRSPEWRELKDFVSDRLGLPWDEFNRVPVAGVTNITRLTQMLDQACFAFLVMTAEDEQADGNQHARMNVIHEVGLFQGRLGFERAIVLLEEYSRSRSNKIPERQYLSDI